MPEQLDTTICHAPFAFEEAHFEAAYFPAAVAFDVVVRPVGSVAPVVVEAVFAVAPAAAVEVSADHFGTDLKRNPPVQHTDPPVVRKARQEKRQGKMQAHTISWISLPSLAYNFPEHSHASAGHRALKRGQHPGPVPLIESTQPSRTAS